jgi:hypothetical protein
MELRLLRRPNLVKLEGRQIGGTKDHEVKGFARIYLHVSIDMRVGWSWPARDGLVYWVYLGLRYAHVNHTVYVRTVRRQRGSRSMDCFCCKIRDPGL